MIKAFSFFVHNTRKIQPGKSLTLNFSWTLVGEFIYIACQWAMMMILTKLGSTKIVGLFALSLAITAPLVIFTSLNLRAIIATDTKDTYCFRDYLNVRLLSLSITSIFIITWLLICQYDLHTKFLIALVFTTKVFDSLSDLIYGLCQQHQRMDRIAQSKILQGILQLMVLGMTFYWSRDIVLATLSMATMSGFVTFVFDVDSVRILLGRSWLVGGASSSNFSAYFKIVLWQILKMGFPMGIVALLGQLNLNMPRYLIEYYLHTKDLGLYSALFSLAFAPGILIGSLTQTMASSLARHFSEGRMSTFRQTLVNLVLFGLANGLLSILVATLFGKHLLTLFYKAEYATRMDLFVWLAVASCFLMVASTFSLGVTATRQFVVQPFVLISMLIINLIVGIVVIPRFHLVGAAWALLGSYLVWGVGSAWIILRATQKNKLVLNSSSGS